MNGATLDRAAELVEQIAARAAHEARQVVGAWKNGYRAGYDAGEEVGYRRAHEEMAQRWAQVARQVKELGKSRSLPIGVFIEARIQPGGALYEAALTRRDGREYTGGPTPWETSDEEQNAA
ncbi:FliH/SctL family protein [Nonomuraea angiospora]|uniref:hypothetical protein n=1 Tax=Nonomuraea angiospora TaxID=46172 RepID=UPI0029B4C952|nr:hypothetical protein [Nonomuraea angiospora]MDX3099701.1 hypothetical protein [Nonomuraea angiospora]